MPIEFEQLTGVEKAGVLVLSLPPDMVRAFLSRLENGEVERVLAAVSRLDEIPPRVQEKVLMEFQELLGQRDYAIRGGRERALDLIERTLDDVRAGEILAKLGRDEKRIDWTIRSYEPAFVAQTIGSEHPQTIALILSQVPSDRGAAVIAALPDDVSAEVVLRLANLSAVSNEVMTDLEEDVAALFGRRVGPSTRVGGTDSAAKMLNRVPKSEGNEILDGVSERNADVANEIRRRMLTFNDLTSIDRRGFQALLREVPTEDLVVALKTASDDMREKVFQNISSRAADQIREESELLGPMRLSEVERVQEMIVDVARRLEEEGRLEIDAGAAGDVLV